MLAAALGTPNPPKTEAEREPVRPKMCRRVRGGASSTARTPPACAALGSLPACSAPRLHQHHGPTKGRKGSKRKEREGGGEGVSGIEQRCGAISLGS